MSYYQCKRCLFISKQKTGMIRHLERKNKCVKLFQAYKFDDFELYKMSLVIIKKKDQKNHVLALEDTKENSLQCKFCLKHFSTKGNLNKHVLKHEDGTIPVLPIEHYQDKYKEDEPQYSSYSYQTFSEEETEPSFPKQENYTPNSSSAPTQNINQTIQNITVNQQFNNFNIINMKYPNGFDKDWDLSQISDDKKLFLINCCNTKYSELLKFILQNDDNLNVIIENETDTGIVYKNDKEKYIHLNKSDIIDQSLMKLNNQLNELCKEISVKNNDIEKGKYESLKINKKYIDYTTNNNNIKSGVQDLLSNIFNEKKDRSIEMMNKIIEAETSHNLLKNNGF